MPKRTRTRARGCTGKIRHSDEAGALAQIQRLIGDGAAQDAYEAYPCRFCSGWHAGHASPKTRNGRR